MKRLRLPLVALLTAATFACAASRPPGAAAEVVAPGPPLRVALATPELELWMEGTKAIDPAEAARTLAQSRTALARAAAGRDFITEGETDLLLVVHAREIARTAERRRAQVLSVVLVVAVVVALIVAVLATSDGGGRRRPAPVHQAVPAGGGRVPAWGRGAGFAPRRFPPPPPIGVSLGASIFVPLDSEPLPPPAPGLPAPNELLAARSWLDGDATELTVVLVEAATGLSRWRRTVKGSANPRNAEEVSRLLDTALADQPFGRRLAPLALESRAPGGARGAAPSDEPALENWPEASPESVLPPEPDPEPAY